MLSRKRVIVIVALVLLMVVGIVLYFTLGGWNPFGGGRVAATVNGEAILVKTLDARMDGLIAQNPALFDTSQGGVEEASVRRSILDSMIDNLLLEQEAAREGISISDQEVQEQVEQRAETYPDRESFEKDLANNGYTMDFFESQIRAGMLVDALMQKKVPDDSVTEAEIQAYYDENIQSFTDGEGVERPLEEVESSVRSILLTRKRATERAGMTASLRAKAKIEILDPQILNYEKASEETSTDEILTDEPSADETPTDEVPTDEVPTTEEAQ